MKKYKFKAGFYGEILYTKIPEVKFFSNYF
jgi:hypothetical protein